MTEPDPSPISKDFSSVFLLCSHKLLVLANVDEPEK
jgi:hypothetical protein